MTACEAAVDESKRIFARALDNILAAEIAHSRFRGEEIRGMSCDGVPVVIDHY